MKDANRINMEYKENFKILQFSDIHYSTDRDDIFFDNARKLINNENPDLIVLTGDVALGEDNEKAAEKVFGFFGSFGVPFTSVFGNHDCEWGSSKDKIFDILQRTDNVLKFEKNPKGYDFGPSVGNHIIDIGDQWALYMIDNGWAYTEDLVKWFKDSASCNKGMAFMHVPFKEYQDIHPDFCSKAVGIGYEPPEYGRVCPMADDLGLFEEFKKNSVKAMFVGHDHLNDYIGKVGDIALGYARTGDYYCYNAKGTHYLDPCRNPNTTEPIERGCKVIILNENGFKCYSRLMNGDKLFETEF